MCLFLDWPDRGSHLPNRTYFAKNSQKERKNWKTDFLKNKENGNPGFHTCLTLYIHCKFLQGTIGSLQGNQATGISYLQGFSMYVITCKEFTGIATNNYRDFYCSL